MEPNATVEGMARPDIGNAAAQPRVAGSQPQPAAASAPLTAAEAPAAEDAAPQTAQAQANQPTVPGDAALAGEDQPESGLPKLAQAFRQILQEEKRNLPAHIVDLLEKMPEASQLEYLLRHRKPLGILGSSATVPAAVPASPQATPTPPVSQPVPAGRRLYENF